jgi:hypothetical protein
MWPDHKHRSTPVHDPKLWRGETLAQKTLAITGYCLLLAAKSDLYRILPRGVETNRT